MIACQAKAGGPQDSDYKTGQNQKQIFILQLNFNGRSDQLIQQRQHFLIRMASHGEGETFRDQPKIQVVVRKRPLNKKELQRNEQDVVEVTKGADIKVRQHKLKVDLTKYTEEHMFKFDSAFGEEVNNQQLYHECVKPIVECAFLGAKVTCFAYGQTGSGKTYTMNGDLENGCPGMYYLGAEDIFSIRDAKYPELTVSVSFFEIYCGKLFDLLNNREQLQARQDGKQNVNIIGLSIKQISSISEFLQMIAHGSAVRITSQNSTNSDSSRSHAILQISLMSSKKLYGKISFIDLAGCERGADTLDQNKQTKIDGAEINKSLLALKECIRALDQGKNHTPFRGSKLTMVLKDSFIGFCRTLMIGNVSPGSGSCENTLNTLRYADRVKELKKGGHSDLTKQEQQARELMLPRSQKNRQIVIKNQDDSDQQIVIAVANAANPVNTIQQKNSNMLHKVETNAQPLKKLKYIQKSIEQDEAVQQPKKKVVNTENNHNVYIDKTKTQVQRKGPLQSTQVNHNENHNPKSVSHANKLTEKSQENSRIRDNRNKSVFGKVDLSGLQKSSFANMRKNVKQPNTERNSFTQNHSLVNLNEKYKQIVGESQKIRTGLQSATNINLLNRYGKKNNDKAHRQVVQPSKHKTEEQALGTELTEWEQILTKFRNWRPCRSEFEEMSVLFEELVKMIMGEQLEISEIHKRLLISDEKMMKESVGLYNQAQKESKNNEEMMEYTARLNKHLSERVNCFGHLRERILIYQYHLKEHEKCESKLIEASQTNHASSAQFPHFEDVGLWQ